MQEQISRFRTATGEAMVEEMPKSAIDTAVCAKVTKPAMKSDDAERR